MKRQYLISGLAAGAALTLLGGCASYDNYDRGYRGDAYYGGAYSGGYYDSDYYGPSYYGGGTVLVPRDGYGGGYRRDTIRHDGDHRDYRRGDNDGDHNRGGNDTGRNFNRGDNNANRNFNRGDNTANRDVQPQPAATDGPAGATGALFRRFPRRPRWRRRTIGR